MSLENKIKELLLKKMEVRKLEDEVNEMDAKLLQLEASAIKKLEEDASVIPIEIASMAKLTKTYYDRTGVLQAQQNDAAELAGDIEEEIVRQNRS